MDSQDERGEIIPPSIRGSRSKLVDLHPGHGAVVRSHQHAQWRLATGQGLIYIVAEKNRRSAPVALVLQTADVPVAAPLQENA